MNINILTFAKHQPPWFNEASETYLKRLPKALKITILRLQEKDQDKMIKKYNDTNKYHNIVLDELGEHHTSHQFAQQLAGSATKTINFWIGGAYGLSDSIKSSANGQLALSKMTCPSHLAQLLLVEQLYRAWTILQHHPYHK